jgi:hypothetical protein
MSRISSLVKGQILLSLFAVWASCSRHQDFTLQTFQAKAELNNAINRYIADT